MQFLALQLEINLGPLQCAKHMVGTGGPDLPMKPPESSKVKFKRVSYLEEKKPQQKQKNPKNTILLSVMVTKIVFKTIPSTIPKKKNKTKNTACQGNLGWY